MKSLIFRHLKNILLHFRGWNPNTQSRGKRLFWAGLSHLCRNRPKEEVTQELKYNQEDIMWSGPLSVNHTQDFFIKARTTHLFSLVIHQDSLFFVFFLTSVLIQKLNIFLLTPNILTIGSVLLRSMILLVSTTLKKEDICPGMTDDGNIYSS